MTVATAPEQSSQPIRPTNQPAEGLKDDSFLIYPRDMSDEQDRIRFTLREVSKTNISEAPKNLQITEASTRRVSGIFPNQVFLPIQSGISDTNTVNWGSGELNEIQRQLANASLDIMGQSKTGLGEVTQGALGDLYRGILEQQGFGNLARLYFAEQAIGVQGLLSRTTGNVLNPNLELLFQGPTLRPFQFQFKLSPRNREEAASVKKIIRFFKQNMAAQTVEGNLFLKAPYVFGIEYICPSVNTAIHPSIGLIKEACALQACTVDYTPLGSYMTYNDSNKTMVSYTISLQFQEIIPVYRKDYTEGAGLYNDIGY